MKDEGVRNVTMIDCGEATLAVERAGDGPNLILIHGAWSDSSTWDPVVEPLAQQFHTIRYDRRGYGKSARLHVEPRTHVEDLLALIRALALDEVTLIGNSLGGLIAIHAALQMPSQIRLVIAHEPPILRLLAAATARSPVAARGIEALRNAQAAAHDGQWTEAARLYVDGMASYPGTWAYLPADIQQGFVANASGFLTDSIASDELDVTAEHFARMGDRLVVTRGGRTSPFMRLLIDQLYREQPQLRRSILATGGHVPHQSSPAEFVALTMELLQRDEEKSAQG